MFHSLLFFLAVALAMPAAEPDMIAAAPGTENNPIPVTLNTASWPNIAEEDCYMALCHYNANTKLMRVNEQKANDNRKNLGSIPSPFKNKGQINKKTTSAEEWPMASTAQGGANARMMPADPDEQKAQGGATTVIANRVKEGQWYKVTLNGHQFQAYCKALFATGGPDKSVCQKDITVTLWNTKVKMEDHVYARYNGKVIHAAGRKQGSELS